MNTQEEFHQFRSVAKQELEKCALGSGWGLLDQVLFVFEPVVQALFVVLVIVFHQKKKKGRGIEHLKSISSQWLKLSSPFYYRTSPRTY